MDRFMYWSALLLLFFCSLSCKDSNEKVQPNTVLELNYDSLYFSFLDKQTSIEITVNKAWEVESLPLWITASPMNGEKGTHTLNISVSDNQESVERKAVFHIVADGVRKSVTIMQTEKAVVVVGEKEVSVSAETVEWSARIGANVPIEAVILNQVKWVRKIESRAITDRNFHFSLDVNSTGEDRMAKIVFRNTDLQIADTVTLTQMPVSVLELKNTYSAAYNQTSLTIPIKTNLDYEVEIPSDQTWLKKSVTKAVEEKQLLLSLEPNNSGEVRTTTIHVNSPKHSISVPVVIKQGINLADGTVITIQKATKGKGIDLVFMGDGYVREEIDQMKYQEVLDLGIKHFFDIEPFTSYREYFNIYQVVVESNESGMTNDGLWPGITQKEVDTRLKARQIANGTDADQGICREYASKARTNSQVDEYVIIVVTNFPYYCGSTYIGKESLCIFPASTMPSPQNYKELMQHEAGGHGFGWLADEYGAGMSTDVEIPESDIFYVQGRQERGIYPNICVMPFEQMASWYELMTTYKEEYPEVGFIEGGFSYNKGVYRSTKTSMMRDMMGDFNAISRYSIISRIKRLAEEPFAWVDFVAEDKLAGSGKQTDYVTKAVAASSPLPPPRVRED